MSTGPYSENPYWEELSKSFKQEIRGGIQEKKESATLSNEDAEQAITERHIQSEGRRMLKTAFQLFKYADVERGKGNFGEEYVLKHDNIPPDGALSPDRVRRNLEQTMLSVSRYNKFYLDGVFVVHLKRTGNLVGDAAILEERYGRAREATKEMVWLVDTRKRLNNNHEPLQEIEKEDVVKIIEARTQSYQVSNSYEHDDKGTVMALRDHFAIITDPLMTTQPLHPEGIRIRSNSTSKSESITGPSASLKAE